MQRHSRVHQSQPVYLVLFMPCHLYPRNLHRPPVRVAAWCRNAAQLYAMSGMRAMQLADQNASALEMNGLLSAGGGFLKSLTGLFPKQSDVYGGGY